MGRELISNEETVTFDSKKEYHLVMREAENLIEVDRLPLFIKAGLYKRLLIAAAS
jgi:hypothetical protein